MAARPRPAAAGEEVVLDLHPHWKRLLLPILLVPTVAGVASYLVFVLPAGTARTPLREVILAAALLVLVRFALWPWLRWQATHYQVTTRRLVVRWGLVPRRGRDIALADLADVWVHQTLVERVLRCGTLTLASYDGDTVELTEVPTVRLVQAELLRSTRP